MMSFSAALSSTRLFSFSEEHNILMIADVFKPTFNKFLSFFHVARMSVPKLVCEVSYASGFAWFVSVDGGLGCEEHDE
jgi:hypothetical protein